MTLADLRRNFERQMIVSRVEQNEVFGKVGVSEEEARKYYDAHLAEFTTPPSVTLREILVGVTVDPKGINVAKDEAAYRYLAESIRMHPDQETLKAMMQAAGLERVDYFNLAAGVVALHRGFKT